MAKKKKQTNKEKQLKRKLEALRANQKRYETKVKPALKIKENESEKEPTKDKKTLLKTVDKVLSDDSIIITDDKHIKADLLKTTIFTIAVFTLIFALRYFHPLI